LNSTIISGADEAEKWQWDPPYSAVRICLDLNLVALPGREAITCRSRSVKVDARSTERSSDVGHRRQVDTIKLELLAQDPNISEAKREFANTVREMRIQSKALGTPTNLHVKNAMLQSFPLKYRNRANGDGPDSPGSRTSK